MRVGGGEGGDEEIGVNIAEFLGELLAGTPRAAAVSIRGAPEETLGEDGELEE